MAVDSISRDLLRAIQQQYVLDWNGIHGKPHWLRVHENGGRLSKLTGANKKVVALFAFLHDSMRNNDGRDLEYGLRAARYVQELAGSILDLGFADQDCLAKACRDHNEGFTRGDITVMTCWDADRLDLGRVGIIPQPDRLCTEAARDSVMIEWTYNRSIQSS